MKTSTSPVGRRVINTVRFFAAATLFSGCGGSKVDPASNSPGGQGPPAAHAPITFQKYSPESHLKKLAADPVLKEVFTHLKTEMQKLLTIPNPAPMTQQALQEEFSLVVGTTIALLQSRDSSTKVTGDFNLDLLTLRQYFFDRGYYFIYAFQPHGDSFKHGGSILSIHPHPRLGERDLSYIQIPGVKSPEKTGTIKVFEVDYPIIGLGLSEYIDAAGTCSKWGNNLTTIILPKGVSYIARSSRLNYEAVEEFIAANAIS